MFLSWFYLLLFNFNKFVKIYIVLDIVIFKGVLLFVFFCGLLLGFVVYF